MINNALQKLDGIPEKALLFVDLGLACFVGLAHGGALLIALAQQEEQLEFVRPLASVTLPLAGLIIVSSVAALVWKRSRSAILGAHAVVLTLGAAALLGWAVSILINGIPKITRFSWSPGMLTFLCVYPFYLLRRTVLARFGKRFVVKYLHVMVLVIALAVDIGVFVKVLSLISSMWSELGQ